jgi:hypothetical protein
LGCTHDVTHAVEEAIGVTAKPVFLQAEVRDVNVFAMSEFDRSGICRRVCICFKKQSSHVMVVTVIIVSIAPHPFMTFVPADLVCD